MPIRYLGDHHKPKAIVSACEVFPRSKQPSPGSPGRTSRTSSGTLDTSWQPTTSDKLFGFGHLKPRAFPSLNRNTPGRLKAGRFHLRSKRSVERCQWGQVISCFELVRFNPAWGVPARRIEHSLHSGFLLGTHTAMYHSTPLGHLHAHWNYKLAKEFAFGGSIKFLDVISKRQQ